MAPAIFKKVLMLPIRSGLIKYINRVHEIKKIQINPISCGKMNPWNIREHDTSLLIEPSSIKLKLPMKESREDKRVANPSTCRRKKISILEWKPLSMYKQLTKFVKKLRKDNTRASQRPNANIMGQEVWEHLTTSQIS